MRYCRPILLYLIAQAGLAHAEPTVLYDNGDTVPIARYVNLAPHTAAPLAGVTVPDTPMTDSDLLPIRTPELTLGRISTRTVDFPELTAPVCVIGSDDRSLAWLVIHHARLQQLATRCVLVQAESVADLNRVARFSAGIPVLPAVGAELAQKYGLTHYPVLLSKKWIEQ